MHSYICNNSKTEFAQLFIEFQLTVDKYYVVRSTAAFNSMDCH